MSDDLRDDLEAIEGVGPATADAILGVIDDHCLRSDEGYLRKAKQAAMNDAPRQAQIYLQRYVREDSE